MAYSFFIQPYGSMRVNIENAFKCKYMSFTNLLENGQIKNAYTEDYAEADGVRQYIPSTPTHKTTECVLSLLFPTADCEGASLSFQNFVAGKKVEWYDTFRGKYVTLVMTSSPKMSKEILYGNRPFRVVQYTFTNIYGKYFNTSQI